MENNIINISKEELEKLISEECYAHVIKYHDEKYDDMHCVYKMVREMSVDILNSNHSVLNRLQQIESMISAHSVGVQNVYAEFKAIKDKINSENTIRKFISMVGNMEDYKKQIKEVKDYLASDGVTRIYQEFQDFKYRLLKVLKNHFKE